MILRPIEVHDAEALRELASDPEVFASTQNRPADTLEEWRALLAAVVDRQWVFTAEVDGEIAGSFSMLRMDGQYAHRAEIGGWLGRKFWGNGLATEAFCTLIAFGAAQGLERIEARGAEDNEAVCRAGERSGMRLESVAMRGIVRGSRTIDELLYVWIKGVDRCPG